MQQNSARGDTFMSKKKIVVTIEARMTSSRLPGKVLMESCGKPLLQHMIERIKRSQLIDDVVVATTVNRTDDPVVELCKKIGCSYFRGSEEDVLLRVLEAAKSVSADVIVETTGDCPCIDWRHIDYLVDFYIKHDFNFVANNTIQSFPDGFDIRIFSTENLERVSKMTDDRADHEHVSIYFPKHPEIFSSYNWEAQTVERRPELEVTLDEKGDYLLIDSIFSALYKDNVDFSCTDVINYIDNNPELLDYIKDIKRKCI